MLRRFSDLAQNLADLWNEMVAPLGLPRVEKLSESRRKKIYKAYKTFDSREEWVAIFEEFDKSLFLKGKAKGDGRIPIDFDLLLAVGKDGTEHYIKVQAGRYRDTKGNGFSDKTQGNLLAAQELMAEWEAEGRALDGQDGTAALTGSTLTLGRGDWYDAEQRASEHLRGEDLTIFPLEKVLESLEWARKNLRDFPKIPDLLRRIEGDPQEHAEKAWQTFLRMIGRTEWATMIVDDPVLARVIKDIWAPSWWATVQKFESTPDYTMNDVRKRFLRRYETVWGDRYRLTEGRTFKGLSQSRHENGYGGTIQPIEYFLVSDGHISLDRRVDVTVKRQPYVMPPEETARLDKLMEQLGKAKDMQRYAGPVLNCRLPRDPEAGDEDETGKVLPFTAESDVAAEKPEA
jgi:hypothetical protein